MQSQTERCFLSLLLSSSQLPSPLAVLVVTPLVMALPFVGEKQLEEEESQAPSATQNGSPRLNRTEITSRPSPEVYDVRLQRKENEGFGFVILTSKNKPPPGGKSTIPVWHRRLRHWACLGQRSRFNSVPALRFLPGAFGAVDSRDSAVSG